MCVRVCVRICTRVGKERKRPGDFFFELDLEREKDDDISRA